MRLDVREITSHFSDDFINLIQLQKMRFFCQLRSPIHQDFEPAGLIWLMIGVSNNQLDDLFSHLQIHRRFLGASAQLQNRTHPFDRKLCCSAAVSAAQRRSSIITAEFAAELFKNCFHMTGQDCCQRWIVR